jgi:hypothetical protein
LLVMADEPLPSGWLPPRPPAAPADPPPTAAPAPAPPARGAWPPPPRGDTRQAPAPRAPSSPPAVAGITSSASGLLLLLMTAGVSFAFTIALALAGLLFASQAQRRLAAGVPGRPGQVRTAVVLARVTLALAALAAIVWMVLAANGITPSDLEQALERQAQRMQRG